LDKTRSLFLNRLVIIPVTENLIYSGYLLQRYDDYEDFTRKLSSFFQNGKRGIKDGSRWLLSVIFNKIEQSLQGGFEIQVHKSGRTDVNGKISFLESF
jgi:hypothetical protein